MKWKIYKKPLRGYIGAESFFSIKRAKETAEEGYGDSVKVIIVNRIEPETKHPYHIYTKVIE